MIRVARGALPLVGFLLLLFFPLFLLSALSGESEAAPGRLASRVADSGVFGPPQTLTPTPHTLGDGGPTAILLADLDRDHDLDLVVANSDSNYISVLRRRANGTFSEPDSYVTGNGPVSLAVGDVNHDTHPDLIVGSCHRDTGEWGVHVLLGLGDGAFDDAYRVDYWLDWDGRCSITLGDVNRDAHPDVAVAAGRLRVLLGDGDGTFTVGADYGNLGDEFQHVVMGDLSQDGNPDLVVADALRPTMSVFLGNVDGEFYELERHPTWGLPSDVALGDMDGDEHVDIAVAGAAGLVVYRGLGLGTFDSPHTINTREAPVSIALGDLDADDDLDLVVGHAYSNSVSVLLGNGDGTFQTADTYPAGGDSVCVTLGDLDGDGALDLATVSEQDSTLSLLHNSLGPFDHESPTLSLGIFQNPYLTQHLDIYLAASEPLDPESLELTVAGHPQSPSLVQPWDLLWMANYRLTSTSGSVVIAANANDRSGNHGGAIVQFGTRFLAAGRGGSLKAPDGRAWISLPPDALARDAFLVILAQPCTSDDTTTPDALVGPGEQLPRASAEAGPLVYRISPAGILRGRGATLTISYAPDALPAGASLEGLYIERLGEGPLESYLDRARHTLTAQVPELGDFRLAYGRPGMNMPADREFLHAEAGSAGSFGSPHGAAVLRFELHAASRTRVSVHDVLGREVARLLDDTVGPGVHQVTWSGLSSSGRPAASSIYFFRVETASRAACRRVLVVR